VASFPTDDIGRSGVHGVGLLVTRELRWKFREQHESDLGIDAQVEVMDHNQSLGQLLALQIKAGKSFFRERAAAKPGWVFRPGRRHVEYWLGYTLPVLIVLYDEDSHSAYWQHVTAHTVEVTSREGYRLIVPESNRLVQSAAHALGEIAANPGARQDIGQISGRTGTQKPPPDGSLERRPRRSNVNDAVIIVPGFGGSELVDTDSGHIAWGAMGLSTISTLMTSIEKLSVTDDERLGRLRLTATRLLRTATLMPGLHGQEPYARLINTVLSAVAHPDAVLEFPYDWRLGIADNAVRLSAIAERHLAKWRSHQMAGKEAELILIAHSTGGLVAQYFTGVLGGHHIVRSTVTLGTPFYGAVKPVAIIAGNYLPLPMIRFADACRTMPGLYDMLPTYRCVNDGEHLRGLTVSDIVSIGGSEQLTSMAFALHTALRNARRTPLNTIVGVGQPTAQSLHIKGTGIELFQHIGRSGSDSSPSRMDLGGDSFVIPDAATQAGANLVYVSQTHGALHNSAEALVIVRAEIARRAVEVF
jgi:hypothetical protein